MIARANPSTSVRHQGATVGVQGFGNVGSVSAELLAESGAKIVAVSDWKGGVYNAAGLDIPGLIEYTHKNKTVAGFSAAEPLTNDQLFALDLDVLIPAALENQITMDNAATIRAKVIVEGANGPTTPDAHQALHDRGIFIVPDILANSAGVTTSYFEAGLRLLLKEVNERLGSEDARPSRLLHPPSSTRWICGPPPTSSPSTALPPSPACAGCTHNRG